MHRIIVAWMFFQYLGINCYYILLNHDELQEMVKSSVDNVDKELTNK